MEGPRMSAVLVTGGCGFIGSNFIHYLLESDPTVEVIVDLEAQQVHGDGFSYCFEIDAFARECLDEIALVERHDPEIATYEKTRAEWLPTAK